MDTVCILSCGLSEEAAVATARATQWLVVATIVLVFVTGAQVVLSVVEARKAAKELERSAIPIIGDLTRRLEKACGRPSDKKEFTKDTYERWIRDYRGMVQLLDGFRHVSLGYARNLLVVRRNLDAAKREISKPDWQASAIRTEFKVATAALRAAEKEIRGRGQYADFFDEMLALDMKYRADVPREDHDVEEGAHPSRRR